MPTPPNHISQYKLKGTSLFFALTFTLIIAVTISSIIGLVFLHHEYVDNNLMISERLNIIDKVVTLSEHKIEPIEITDIISKIKQTPDSVEISEEQWGLYDLLKINFLNPQLETTKSTIAMMGYQSPEVSKIGAYVMDEYNPIVVSGTTQLKGTSYLTKAEVKPGSIEGYGYRNESLLFGSKEVHGNERSFDFERKIDSRQIVENKDLQTTDIRDTIYQSFNDDLLVLRADTLLLNNVHIEGHVCIIADMAILIGEGVSIEHAIAIAPDIYIDSRSPIRMQAFASRRIEVFDGTTLLYPSALTLEPHRSLGFESLAIKRSSITLNEGTHFEGVLIADKGASSDQLNKIHIKEGATFKGYIFNQGATELNDDIIGTVFTHRFEHVSKRNRRYVNYIFNSSIDPSLISEIVLHPALKDFSTNKSLVTWLEKS